jgi:hypothetical protein
VLCIPADGNFVDFSAHSNYTELALIELGETEIFPQVGRDTMVNVQGRDVWPIVTGTFGGVDFLHSVLGEFTDKAAQSEVDQLEQSMLDAQAKAESNDEKSIIKELMSKLNIGGNDDIESKTSQLQRKSAAQKEANERGEPFGFSGDTQGLIDQIYPFLEFHDELMKAINEALEKIGLDVIVEKLSEAVSIFVFSLMAPFILPLLEQVKTELKQGSSEVIGSSVAAQHIVFEDDSSSNPTHSMLSKDHFTNLLNEPAGKCASACLKFAVPLLMEAWDNEGRDINQVCDEIIGGVFHHPAFRNGEDRRPGSRGRQAMFAVVEEWWNSKDSSEQDEFRSCLSREGVEAGRHHKEGVHDSGHGCGKPLKRNMNLSGGGNNIGAAVGEHVGVALENALSGGVKDGDSGLGSMLGGMLGSAISSRLGGDTGSFLQKQTSSSSYESRQESSYESRQESSSYSRGGAEETSYSSRETYETPEYSRTTERYGGGGRGEEERTYERRGGNEESYGGDRGFGGERGERGERGGYGGEERGGHGGGYGGEDRGGYGRQGESPNITPRKSGHGVSDEFFEKEEKTRMKKREEKSRESGRGEKREGGERREGGKYHHDEEDEDEVKGKKKKEKKKDDGEEEEGKKEKKEKKKEKKKDYDADEEEVKNEKKYKKEKKHGEDEDEEESGYKKEKKSKKEKKYDDDEDEEKKEKKYKEKKKYDDEEENEGEKKKKKSGKKAEESGDEDEDEDYKKKKKEKKDKKGRREYD